MPNVAVWAGHRLKGTGWNANVEAPLTAEKKIVHHGVKNGK